MYRVRTYPEARDAIASLPEVALAGYAEALGVMKLVPWSAESINKANPGGEVRQLVFGPEGRGMVTYLVLEDQHLVDVLEVQWSGSELRPRTRRLYRGKTTAWSLARGFAGSSVEGLGSRLEDGLRPLGMPEEQVARSG